MDLQEGKEKFIQSWGALGSSWGINRTVAQIYAMLYLSSEALTADQICEVLGLARSTVSTGLHELLGWGVIHVVHVLGDRRDHFESISDVWEIFRIILRERKRREIDPTLIMLRECVDEIGHERVKDEYVEERLLEMLDFFEVGNSVYEQIEGLPTDSLKRMALMSNNMKRVLKLLGQN